MSTNLNDIQNILLQIVNNQFGINAENIELEVPNDPENGDLSTNIALKICKQVGKNPLDIAQIISDNFKSDIIEKVEVKKPGFVNFFFDNNYYLNIINNIISENEFIFDTNEHNYYNVEFVSANPTGDLHLGHARNAVYGDSIVRLLRKIGNKVDSEYYINDAGSQMDNLGLSVQYFYLKHFNVDVNFPDDGYRGNDIQTIANKIVDEYGDSKLEEPMEWFREYAYSWNLNEIKRVLQNLNVHFDIWTSERDLHTSNLVVDKIEALAKLGDVYTQDDALWLATSKYFDDKDRVLKKQDGHYTYFASDIAYHMDKFDRNYTRLIDVWGGDHHGYINRVKSAISSLGQDQSKFEVLLIQMINILQNNERVKMSKRMGTSVTIKELLEELDVDTLRYFFLMRSPETQVDFDIALAKEQNSNNPIYYIQYANARIANLLERAQENGIKPQQISNNYTCSSLEREIINLLSQYQQVIINAANKRLPHLLCNYLYDVATLYHRYYNQDHVFNNNNDVINDKICIALGVKKVIQDGLNTLGINVKDNM